MSKIKNHFFLLFLAVSAVLAGILSHYASPHPDGLEKVAEDKGFLESATNSAVSGSPLADYGVSGIENARASVGLAGLIGISVTALLSYLVFYMLRRLKGGNLK